MTPGTAASMATSALLLVLADTDLADAVNKLEGLAKARVAEKIQHRLFVTFTDFEKECEKKPARRARSTSSKKPKAKPKTKS